MNKPMIIAAVTACLIFALLGKASAQENESEYVVCEGGQYDSVNIEADKNLAGIYIEFTYFPVDFSLAFPGSHTEGTGSVMCAGKFINRYVDMSDYSSNTVNIIFSEPVWLNRVTYFTDKPRQDVQIWEDPCDSADLVLFSTHADDEQLFFAGVLPYYAAKGYDVQVVYFTDHKNLPLRRQELLAGLWTVGVSHYPLINTDISDVYSGSVEAALANLAFYDGKNYEDVLSFQTECLRRFKPLVAVGHDLNGEYGHGQHMLNAKSLAEAVTVAGDETKFADSAEKYGIWETPKLYLHLYEKDTVVMNVFDAPLEELGGLSAFNMTQKGFAEHRSQHYTWYNAWLNGGGDITRADQIEKYSPLFYGLYRTTAGQDVEKNDFFENISETHRQKSEREQREAAERQTAEESQTEKESRGGESLRSAPEDDPRSSAEEKSVLKNHNRFSKIVISASAVIAAAVIAFAVLITRLTGKQKRRK